MKLAQLARTAGEWLKGDGALCDVVISSRIRLARNLSGFAFLSKADENARRQIVEIIRSAVKRTEIGKDFFYIALHEADDLERQLLVERHLISRQHAECDGPRGVAVSGNENVALMINEEDHLRIQVLRSGLQLDEAWEQINRLDDQLESELDYAFSDRFGYLTACPTNVGTGIRVSVMLHLPALKLTGEIERVFRAARDMRLAVRGLYGEGTEASGDLYQVSNQATLGKTEEEIIDEFKNTVIPRIIEYEGKARHVLLDRRTAMLEDKIWRAMGALRYARSMSSEETMLLLSHLRMGVNLGKIPDITTKVINELFLLTQPAHLQAIMGKRLDGEQRSVTRASYIRQRLADYQAN